MDDKDAYMQIKAKGACPCCVALSMMYRGAFLYEEAVSTDDTVKLCEEIADTLLEADSMPEGATEH